MISITIILLLAASANAISDEECARINNKTLSNEFLEGTWYDIMEFRSFLTPSFCTRCRSHEYKKATQAEVDVYKQKFANTELPFSFDTNPVWYDLNSFFNGVLAGETEVKYFVLNPENPGSLQGGMPYMTIVHNKINDDFVLRYQCVFQSTTVELISKKRYPTDGEVQAAVDALPNDVKRLQRQRVCRPTECGSYRKH